jgi:transcriptional regulator with XRE-family HTH domain
VKQVSGQASAAKQSDIAAVSTAPGPGAKLRSLRHERGLSLQDLATAAGVSVGMLSQIERDRANPSLRVLTQIRMALGVSLSELFDDAPPRPADPPFVRRADRRGWLELGYISKELLSPVIPNHLQFMILHVPPRGTSGDQPLSYPAEKGGMILRGELMLKVKDEEVALREGDSFLFNSLDPHSFRNPTDEPTQVLWIIGAVHAEQQL